MERIAVYPGSFDPIHRGHMDIATRASALFDQLIVAVYARPNKHLLFSVEERVALAEKVLGHLPNLEVMTYTGLTVAFAKAHRAKVLVRGLRVVSDFEFEYQMALTNNQLAPEIETVCLITRKEYAFLTSSIVKEVFMLRGDVSQLVVPCVEKALEYKRVLVEKGDSSVKMISLRD